MKKSKITYHDIAKKAQVGIGTVSRYFNNYGISEEARNKISEVLKKENYVPNYAASTLKKPNRDVYLILPFNGQENANVEIVNGVKHSLDKENINFFVFFSSNDSVKYEKDLLNLTKRNSYGLILLLPKFSSPQLLECIKSINTTKVIVYNRTIDDVFSIGIEDDKMFSDLAALIDEKYSQKNICFIGLTDLDVTTGKIRTRAFKNSIRKNNLKQYLLEKNDYESVEEIMPDLIENSKTDIIVCATHTIALSVNHYFLTKNIRKNFVITDIARFGRTDFLNNFEISILIDYFSIGKNIGNKMINKEYKMENLFKIM